MAAMERSVVKSCKKIYRQGMIMSRRNRRRRRKKRGKG